MKHPLKVPNMWLYFVLKHGFLAVFKIRGMENGFVSSYLNPSNRINRIVFWDEICFWLCSCWVCCATLHKHYPTVVDQSTMNSGKNPSVFFGLTASNKFPSIVSETHEVFDSGQLLWIRNVISRPWHLCVNIHQYSPSFVGRLAKKSLYDIHIQPTQTGLYPIFSASYPQVQWWPKTQGAHMVGGFKHDFK